MKRSSEGTEALAHKKATQLPSSCKSTSCLLCWCNSFRSNNDLWEEHLSLITPPPHPHPACWLHAAGNTLCQFPWKNGRDGASCWQRCLEAILRECCFSCERGLCKPPLSSTWKSKDPRLVLRWNNCLYCLSALFALWGKKKTNKKKLPREAKKRCVCGNPHWSRVRKSKIRERRIRQSASNGHTGLWLGRRC